VDQEQEDSLLPVDQGGPKDFDVNKADQIFDLLLQEGQIQLSQGQVIP
jgi:hypothetical protein